MKTLPIRTSLAIVGLSALAAAAVVSGSITGSAADPAARDDAGVTSVRNATEKFHDVDVAVAHGYVPAGPCSELEGTGGMGVHYLQPDLAADGRLVSTQPEILLYEPTPDGLVLVGVEYFVAEDNARGARPSVLGRPLDGPMPGHNAQMPTHYDLHLWVWKDNPRGLTATWNPAVSCRSAS